MKAKLSTLSLTLGLVCLIPLKLLSADLLKANDDFKTKQYASAKQEYLAGAKLGSAHAYYQLGTMYLKGLGGETDVINALIYFSLAADQNYHNAKSILNKMLAQLSEQKRQEIEALLANNKNRQVDIQQKYFPIIQTDKLNQKITFDGETELENRFYAEDIEDDLNIDLVSSFEDEDSADSEVPLLTVKTPFLIVEHDVARDGSVRYLNQVQKFGSAQRYIDAYRLFPLAKPEFNGKAVEFVHRSFMGTAVYDQFKIIDEQPSLYKEIRRITRKAESSDALADQYQYAMALLNFPWLEKTPNQAENLLAELAKKGHPGAMHEYGMKLYRAQKQIDKAIYWISEASKFGLARSEYRLAKILQTSPWVVQDEQKALFWYESALAKGHAGANIRAAEIKLTSSNEALKDINGAIIYLNSVKTSQHNNPEYDYLLALSYKDREQRDFKLVVKHLERAINMGNSANWDVSEWENLLSRLTTGRVRIIE
ncbi:tetratricopeptide repeat protein [Catenovulum adriaticum]|uniref:Sel1 repeat family protein n=1 Tax=Catenovulum adriaticum TaxID=2984846 RepID=A0ABY7ARR0_9ALTE|nr:sel1 repeat family protein [Catenovulum sp. TS8]WAJ71948.1 sel1 repeat family protein [Catenovulum sp. TS8]